ncbi:MAG: DUF58 domain-containing protein [Acidobacteriota bacterium]
MTLGPMAPPSPGATAKATGRWPFGFGPRFITLLVAGFAWLGPAVWDARFITAMLAWDALVAIGWGWDLKRLPAPELLTLRRRWSGPAALNAAIDVAVDLENAGARPIQAIVLDHPPPSLVDALPRMRLDVDAAGRATARYTVRPRLRGNLPMGAVHVRYRSRLGLAERWASAALGQDVRVYPDLAGSQRVTLYLIRSRQIEQERRLKRRRGLGREFESLREYRQGDPWRDLCWTASARRGKLITKVYQVERDQTVWLVIDAGRLLRASLAGLTKLDYAINAALSLAQVALHSGDRVGLLAYGRRPQLCLSPARGAAHLRSLVEGLADVRAEPSEADHLRAARMLLSIQKRRSLVIWLTDMADSAMVPEVVEGASQVGVRHVVLFMAVGQPGLSRAIASSPATPARMYRYAAGLEIAERRSLLLSRLSRRGAYTAEVEPAQVGAVLVNQYLRIKERGVI